MNQKPTSPSQLSVDQILTLIEMAATAARQCRAKALYRIGQASISSRVTAPIGVSGDLRAGGDMKAQVVQSEADKLMADARNTAAVAQAETMQVLRFAEMLVMACEAEKASAEQQHPGPRLVRG